MRTEGQTEHMAKLIVAFRNFLTSPKIQVKCIVYKVYHTVLLLVETQTSSDNTTHEARGPYAIWICLFAPYDHLALTDWSL
jgi:hypothetical protein